MFRYRKIAKINTREKFEKSRNLAYYFRRFLLAFLVMILFQGIYYGYFNEMIHFVSILYVLDPFLE